MDTMNHEVFLMLKKKRLNIPKTHIASLRFHGEQVVKACLEAGAHHLDLSGEPQYLETIQLRYHETKLGDYSEDLLW